MMKNSTVIPGGKETNFEFILLDQSHSFGDCNITIKSGFLYKKDNIANSDYAYACVSDGIRYVYQGVNGIEVLITDPHFDSSLYVSKEKFRFEYDAARVFQLNELFENHFDRTTQQLYEYLVLFRDTSINTQFARTTISDIEIKECTDAIFNNPTLREIDFSTEEGMQKLYELQYREYQKRDETMLIPFSADEPNWEPKAIHRDVTAKILKPIHFTNPSADKFFGDWYKGEKGEVIYMSEQHFLYFEHKGCVELVSETN